MPKNCWMFINYGRKKIEKIIRSDLSSDGADDLASCSDKLHTGYTARLKRKYTENSDIKWSGKESKNSEGNSFPDCNPVWKEVVHSGDDQTEPVYL